MDTEAIKTRINAYERLMRLDKPIGTLLMRSAGCVMNDISDRKYDPHVKRTRDRPLATGEIRVIEAVYLAVFLLLVSFAMVLMLGKLTVKLSFVALAIAASYPLFKRFFPLPQAYLGLAFGFGIPMAFAAQLDMVPKVAWWLLAANVFWAIAYDTEYAMVDRDDDVNLGIKTSAITFGRWDIAAVMACYAAMQGILITVGRLMHFGKFSYAGLAVAGAMMIWHYFMIRDRSREGSFRAFNHNNWVGAAIFAGIAVDYWMKGVRWTWN